MLNLSKLENARFHANHITAACPVCRAAGHDRKGDHLWIKSLDGSGPYGCIRGCYDKEIFSLVGILENRELTPEEKRQWAKEKRERELAARREQLRITDQNNLTARIQQIRERMLAPYLSSGWKADLWHSSEIRLDDPGTEPHEFITALFKPEDSLWMGDRFDTGKPKHAANFKTCREWLKLDVLPPRIAAGTFHPGSISRGRDSVKTSSFIILECDDIIGHEPRTPEEKERNKSLSHALNLYAQDKLGLTLRAVIDTSNKSLHAWYDRPPEPAMNALRKMAAGLRIDQCILENCPYSPLRMPHCIHEKTNTPARLLYLNPITR